MEGGSLAADFAALAPTVTLTEVSVGRSSLVRRIGRTPLLGPLLKELWHHVVTPRVVEQKPRLVYANTVATARLLRQVVPAGVFHLSFTFTNWSARYKLRPGTKEWQ